MLNTLVHIRNTLLLCHKYALWRTAANCTNRKTFLKFSCLLLWDYEVIDQVSVGEPRKHENESGKVNWTLHFISLGARCWEQEFNKDGDSECCLGHSLKNLQVRTGILNLMWSITVVRGTELLDWQYSKTIWGVMLWLIYIEKCMVQQGRKRKWNQDPF